MSDETDVTPAQVASTPPAIPWWQSKIVVGAAVALVSYVVQKLKLDAQISSADVREIVETLLTMATAGGTLWTIVHRVKQTEAPKLTASKAKAQAITDAVQATSAAQLPSGKRLDDMEPPTWMR